MQATRSSAMNRISARGRRAVAVCAVLALLLGQWSASAHLCLAGWHDSAASTAATEIGADCHRSHANLKSSGTGHPVGADVDCRLHCAQPDGSPTSVQAKSPPALPSGDLALLALRLNASASELSFARAQQGPPQDARRRLIERGALLI